MLSDATISTSMLGRKLRPHLTGVALRQRRDEVMSVRCSCSSFHLVLQLLQAHTNTQSGQSYYQQLTPTDSTA